MDDVVTKVTGFMLAVFITTVVVALVAAQPGALPVMVAFPIGLRALVRRADR